MLADIANERSSRPTKTDGILNLISHSRSRSGSRSKGQEAQVDEVDVPVLPADAHPDPNSPHKPPQLLHSRPLSTATTNTASTVTPTNVTPRKRAAPSRIPIPSVKEEQTPATPEVKQPAKKNFSIFGIPLPSPRKSSFGSPSTTPSKELSSAPVRRKRSPSPRRAAAASPKSAPNLPEPKTRPEIGEGPAPSSSLSKFFVGTGMRVSVSNPERPQPASPTTRPSIATSPSKIPMHPAVSHKPTGAHISPSTIVAEPITPKPALKQPSRKYMSEVGNTARVQEPVTPTPASRIRSSASSVGASAERPRVLSGTSAVSAAPATRIRSSISNPRASIVGPRTSTGSTLAPPTPRARVNSTGAIQPGSRTSAATATTSTSSLSTRERRTSTDSSHGYRPYRPGAQLLGIEERADGDPFATKLTASGSGKGDISAAHVIDKSPSAVAGGTSTTTAHAMTSTAPKSTIGAASRRKHGSFDFERPGWGVRGATSSLGVGSRTRRDREPIRGASVDGRPDRGTDPGIAGIGAARLYASTSGTHRTVKVVAPAPPPPTQIEPNHTGASTSTTASQSNGATSSWGRSTGKRLSAGLTKLTSGFGLGKSTKSATSGKERQHGKFPFEPPVPPMPIGIHREPSAGSERSRERDRPQWEREERDRRMKPPLSPKGHSASLSTSSTTSSTHTGVSVGHRSGTKGRSLDLGLGLAWAPTKVREDAVMPESSFGRTLSANRREQQGKEVAEVFRNALDEDGYRNFKKYVHRFDAREIPFDGPTGIVTRVERLLRKAQHLADDQRRELLDSFVKLILQTA
ncbi:hypothetical protein DFH08DRAFT_503309 [Mycena albidolilacea]|uniref:Uncharacterized protein n=1 Tax=Mycena albidolilacea TaxID=1033008 RepID=A0AAD7AD55_9AGAR|nr:hypothetical protein DFH08DRAFT_503309 [Mycena albidolilacea]